MVWTSCAAAWLLSPFPVIRFGLWKLWLLPGSWLPLSLEEGVSQGTAPSGASGLGTTCSADGALLSDTLLAAISWAKMLLLLDAAGFTYRAKR